MGNSLSALPRAIKIVSGSLPDFFFVAIKDLLKTDEQK